MRINIYSQELTSEVLCVSKETNGVIVTGMPCLPNGELNGSPRRALPALELSFWERDGKPKELMGFTNPYRFIQEDRVTYHAAQLILHSSPMLHHPPMDDDRSAITFWLPKSNARRHEFATAFEEIAKIFRNAPTGTGLD